jgi:hypothetical protein
LAPNTCARNHRYVSVRFDPNIRGVLGQWFLAQFDYTIDLRDKSLAFGKVISTGSHVPFTLLNGRMVLSTNLGDLALDAGAGRLVLFGESGAKSGELRAFTGSKTVGLASRTLSIGGQNVWHGEAVTMPRGTEPGINGLLPLSVFHKVYICNTQRYLVYE